MAQNIDNSLWCCLEELHEDPEKRLRELREHTVPDEIATQKGVFSALANEKRLAILSILRSGECCVCELQAALDIPQSTVASHLRTLREAGLVTRRKEENWRYYRLADPVYGELLDLAMEARAE